MSNYTCGCGCEWTEDWWEYCPSCGDAYYPPMTEEQIAELKERRDNPKTFSDRFLKHIERTMLEHAHPVSALERFANSGGDGKVTFRRPETTVRRS